MNEVKAIAKNTIWQFGGKIISTILGLTAIAIMTRSLGVEQFGWYATAIGFLQFIGIFTDFGFTVVTSNMLSEPAHDKKKLLNNLFTWRLLTAIIAQLILPFTIFFFPYPAPIKWAIIIMAISFVGVSLNQIFIAYYQTKLTLHLQAIGEVLGRIFLVIGLALVASGNFGFLPMMAVITFASLVYTGYLWFKCESISLNIDRVISKAIFIKMWPVALAVIFNCFYLQGDRVILPLYASQTEVGLYGAAYRVIDIGTQISAMLIGMLMPLITFAYSRNLKDKFVIQSQRSFDIMALFLLPIIAGAMALAEPIMRFVAGDEFASSGYFLRIQALILLGICFGMVFGHINLAINKQKKSLWIYFIVAILGTASYFIFIPLFGGVGAAWVRVGTELIAGIGLMIIAGYFGGFWPKMSAFLKILLSSSAMGFVVWLIQPANLFVSILTGAIIYGVLILALRVISKQTLSEILVRNK